MSLEMKSKNDVIVYILAQKAAGKTKEEIFDDLIDNHKINNVFARSTIESIRWNN